jgi:hypothetical protein
MQVARKRWRRAVLLLGAAAAAAAVARADRAAAQGIDYRQDASFPAAGMSFREVSWLTVSPDGNIYVLQRGWPNVVVLSPSGQAVSQWATSALAYPHSLRFRALPNGAQRILVTDMQPPGQGLLSGHCVKEFVHGGELTRSIGRCGPETGGSGLDPVQFDKVTDVATDSGGSTWISDGDLAGLNNRVLQLDAGNNVLQVWSAPGNQPGSAPGTFDLPHALDIDSCDRVFVADALNRRVQVLRTDGSFLQQIQCFGDDGVYGMRVAKSATGAYQLFTTSSPTSAPTGGTVRVFDLAPTCTAPKPIPGDCATSAQWTISLPPAPMTAMLHSIDVGPDGSLYIATLGGDLPPQKWVPVPVPKTTSSR